MIRAFRPSDMAAIVHVRTHVIENHLSVEQMAEIGITPQSIQADIATDDLGCWVAEDDGTVVAFSMADRRDANIFALFVLPEREGKGFGSKLLDCAEQWLKQQGHREARLDTGRGTRAYDFYLKRGWRLTTKKAGYFAEDDVFRKLL